MKVRLLLVLAPLCVAVGCGESQLEGKPSAKVEEMAPRTPATEAGQAPEGELARAASVTGATEHEEAKRAAVTPPPSSNTKAEKPQLPPLSKRSDPMEGAERALVLDKRRSTLSFVGRSVTMEHQGDFSAISGTAKLKGYEFKTLKVAVQMDSVSSDHPKLTNHLKSADFFNAAKYPSARFVATKVRPGGEGVATHTITGELSLLAVTKRITFPATIVVTDAGATGLAEFTINRKDFGIVYPGRPDDLISDQVLLKLNLAYLDERYLR